MKHKSFTIIIASVACLMLGGCYELMLVPVYVTDRTTHPGDYIIGDLDNKAGFDINNGSGSINLSTHVSGTGNTQNGADWPAQQVSQGTAAILILLEQARFEGRVVVGDDTVHAADTAAYTDTLTLVSADEARVADWMLARVYERYIVAVDYDRQTATYTCYAYRRKRQSTH